MSTENEGDKICPFMSRPKQGDTIFNDRPLYDSEQEMIKYGWVIIDGKPFSNVISCQRERCAAWVNEVEPEVISCGLTMRGKECTMIIEHKGIDPLNKDWLWCDSCPDARYKEGKSGYCRLIEEKRT